MGLKHRRISQSSRLSSHTLSKTVSAPRLLAEQALFALALCRKSASDSAPLTFASGRITSWRRRRRSCRDGDGENGKGKAAFRNDGFGARETGFDLAVVARVLVLDLAFAVLGIGGSGCGVGDAGGYAYGTDLS